ncbi:TetR/AcrR family transcriptional regulator [Mycolicibacterium lacusdiani]|uniref:TetR/AcrR family transcriptional regulator n=1 Tax=Mycolicibacterium lacusdiani TaxID=2895283 RepID=UPI001F346450|nr:TetR/AcrR family transcriptional regulator [Mycolicibacterium lacusdiani]
MVENEDGKARNKRATRQALRKAVLELGLERGLADVSVSEITSLAGVSTRTFFNYFDTKEDAALIELFEIDPEELAAFAARGSGADAWPDLSAMFAADADRAHREGQDLPRYMTLHARHPLLAARQTAHFSTFLTALADAIALRVGGSTRTRMRSDLMAGSCITAVRVGLEHWARDGARRPPGRYVHKAFDAFNEAFSR